MNLPSDVDQLLTQVFGSEDESEHLKECHAATRDILGMRFYAVSPDGHVVCPRRSGSRFCQMIQGLPAGRASCQEHFATFGGGEQDATSDGVGRCHAGLAAWSIRLPGLGRLGACGARVEGLSTVDHVRARAGQLGIDPTDLIAALGGLPEQVRAVLADVGSGLAAPLTQMASALMLADQTKQEQCLDDTRIVHARNELQVLAQEYRQVTDEAFATNEELLDAHRKLRKQVAENEDMFMGVVRALSSAIDAKDTYTHNHSQRVTRVAMLIASEMGLPEKDLRTLEVAGFLHDIGKIGMPENILNKPGRLTDEEYNIVKMHPGTGARILDAIPQLRELVKIIKHHHERLDGGGYPDGLYGQSIPLGARILAVADTYDAITSDRPYRKGAPCEVATEEIRRCCGKQFDPEVVEAMDRVEAKGLLQGDEVAVALADGSSCLATGAGG